MCDSPCVPLPFGSTGTSAAAPNVAAIALLMLQEDSSLDPIAVYTILEETAIDMETPGFDFDSGYGLVDGFAALQMVEMPTEMPVPIPTESPVPPTTPTQMPVPMPTESPVPPATPTEMPNPTPPDGGQTTPDDGPCVGPLTVGRLFFSFDFFLCLFSVIAQSVQGLFGSAP